MKIDTWYFRFYHICLDSNASYLSLTEICQKIQSEFTKLFQYLYGIHFSTSVLSTAVLHRWTV